MSGKSRTSYSRKSLLEELESSELDGLAAPPQPSGAQQLVVPESRSDGSQWARPIVTGSAAHDLHEDLNKLQIRDKIANGGMSSLELQQRLQTDVFMTFEERAAYNTSLDRGPTSEPKMPDLSALGGPAAITTSAPSSASIDIVTGESFGADGALAPQGVMAPQGLLTKVGMLGSVQGLMGIRSDGPGGSFSPSQPQAAPAQQTQVPSMQNSGESFSPISPRAQAESHAASTAFAPVQNHFDGNAAFQPSQNGNGWFSQAMWGSKNSPWVVLFTKLGALLMAILGFGGGKKGVPPHRRGGSH